MNKIVLALLVTTLALAPSAPAQTCALSSYSNCLVNFPGADWLALVLQGYCDLAQLMLCSAGF